MAGLGEALIADKENVLILGTGANPFQLFQCFEIPHDLFSEPAFVVTIDKGLVMSLCTALAEFLLKELLSPIKVMEEVFGGGEFIIAPFPRNEDALLTWNPFPHRFR